MKTLSAFRRFVFFTTLLLTPLSAWSSAQLGEWIFFQGEKWILLDKPIEKDVVLAQTLNRSLPDDICCSMANSSGYTATWAIEKVNCYCTASILRPIQKPMSDSKPSS